MRRCERPRATRPATARRCTAARSRFSLNAIELKPPEGTDASSCTSRRRGVRTAAIRRQPARRATRAGLSAARARGGGSRAARAPQVKVKKAGSSREKLSGQAQVSSCRPRGAVGRVACARGGGGGRARLRCRLRAQRSCRRPSRGRRGARTIESIARRKSQRRSAPAGGRGARPQSILIIRRAFDRFGQTAFPKIEVAGRPRSGASRARAWAVRARAARWRGNCRRHGIRLWVVIRLVWSSVQLVGATTNETTGSSLAGRRRARNCAACARRAWGLRQALCVPSPRVGTS